jgi:signal transduction histidine kinase
VPALTNTCTGTAGTPSGEEIARLAAYLQRTREQERAALARELHDELGAILTAARLDLAWLAAQPCNQEAAIATRVQALQRVLQQGIELKRRIIEDLHPTILTHLGLAAAVEHLVGEHRTRFDGRLDADVDPTIAVSAEAGLALYRVAQESLTNALKYAGAGRLRVTLTRAARQVVLRVEDDGRGFDPARVGVNRHGLAGMRHRMLAVRGVLQIESEQGGGTVVTARVPSSPRRAAAPGKLATGKSSSVGKQGDERQVEEQGRVRRLHRDRTQPSHP